MQEWHKFRLTKNGGTDYIDHYLYRYSSRESWTDYWARKKTTHLPAHAKATVLDIKNSIHQRMVDITRAGGPESYQDAIMGKGNGVDRNGNNMTSFVGRVLLPELLFLGKVGVYVDKQPIPEGTNGAEGKKVRPYIYSYAAEDIRNWSVDEDGNFTALLLQDHLDVVDPETGLVSGIETRFRHLRKIDEIVEDEPVKGVLVTIYSSEGEVLEETRLLKLEQIPFVVFELSDSLLVDVANHQISLLNLASSDVNYALLSNFPFYVEQYDPHAEGFFRFAGVPEKPIDTEHGNSSFTNSLEKSGKASEAATGKPRTAQVGISKGRRYPKDLEAPGFINPSSEPLMANLKLEDSIKKEIRQLVNLTVANLSTTRASAESKKEDQTGLEAGLATIGVELEYGERLIAKIWADYEGSDSPATVSYPEDYSLKSEAQRREEAKELREELVKIPSPTYQKAMTKRIATIMIGKHVSAEDLAKIHAEIEASVVIVTDPDTIKQDHEAGFVSTKTASKLRGYPEGESDQAAKDHAERARRIALAQSSVSNDSDPGARGVNDLSADNEAAKREKEESQSADGDATATKKTRGDA
jgi:hypothetical protein